MPFVRFAGAVGVNVLANLIAAGIIYLFGQWYGFFPSRPVAIFTAALFVVLGVGLAGCALGVYLKHTGHEVAAEIAFSGAQGTSLAVAFFFVRYTSDVSTRLLFSGLALLGFAALLASIWRAGRASARCRSAR